MYRVYKHLRDGTSHLVYDYKTKKEAIREAKAQQRYIFSSSANFAHDFDVVRVTVKKGRKIIYNKKENA